MQWMVMEISNMDCPKAGYPNSTTPWFMNMYLIPKKWGIHHFQRKTYSNQRSQTNMPENFGNVHGEPENPHESSQRYALDKCSHMQSLPVVPIANAHSPPGIDLQGRCTSSSSQCWVFGREVVSLSFLDRTSGDVQLLDLCSCSESSIHFVWQFEKRSVPLEVVSVGPFLGFCCHSYNLFS